MNFESLVGRINLIQDALQAQAAHAVNLSLTARNWLVGYYIVEFEQHGEDRAKYGTKLLNRLSERINRKGFEPRRLREFRQLYLVYPVLGIEVAKYLKVNQPQLLESDTTSIWRSAPAKLQSSNNQEVEKWRTAPAKLEEWSTPADRLFFRLNYTSLAYLTSIEDPLKRGFYEQETIRGCWTTRELDRQVSSQYYERMGLSKDKKALQRLTAKNAQQITPREILHNPVTPSHDIHITITLQQFVGELQTTVNKSTTKLHQLGGELAVSKLQQAVAEMGDKKLNHFGRELYETRLYQAGKEFLLPFIPVPWSRHLRQHSHQGCSAHPGTTARAYAPVATGDERNQAVDA